MSPLTRPRISLRGGLVTIALVALVFFAVIQGRKIASLEATLSRLQAANVRIQRQEIQFVNAHIRLQQQIREDLARLRRDLMLQIEKRSAPVSSAAAPAGKVPGEDDVPRGEWVTTSIEHQGRLIGPMAEILTIVEGDEMRTELDGRVVNRYRLTLDPSKSPLWLDREMLTGTGPEVGSLRKGISKIEGDTWTWCLGSLDGPRPSEFVSPDRADVFLIVLKRRSAR